MPAIARQIIPCEEYGEVAVPITALLKDGELSIYPEIAGTGFFDIDYRRGNLVLKATKYVGLIPISDEIAIHVRPRTPITSLLRMVARASGGLTGIRQTTRAYDLEFEVVDDPELLYGKLFADALTEIGTHGVLKRYEQEVVENAWRGRLNLHKSAARYYVRGIRNRHVFDVSQWTANVLENQAVKAAATGILARHRAGTHRIDSKEAARINENIAPLTTVDESRAFPGAVGRALPLCIRGLTARYGYYESPLWLALLIATHQGISVEEFGPARVQSVIVNVSAVFEGYIRRLCEDAATELGCDVHNGNTEPLPLFVQGIDVEVSPDIYFTRGDDVIAVSDAKYKREPSRDDRFEVLAHAHAAKARKAIFICPAVESEASRRVYGVTKGGIEFELLRFDLGADTLDSEEEQFIRILSGSLSGERRTDLNEVAA